LGEAIAAVKGKLINKFETLLQLKGSTFIEELLVFK